MIYFASDPHFAHNKEFLYGPRGFTNIEEHDEALIGNWNSIINDDDVVYVLGDIMLKDNDAGLECWNQLRGQKKVIWGNHDSIVKQELIAASPNTEILGYATVIKAVSHNFYLSHYPTLTSGFYGEDHRIQNKIINLCGHTHTKDRFIDMDKGIIYHCEFDCHGNSPVSIEEVISDITDHTARRFQE